MPENDRIEAEFKNFAAYEMLLIEDPASVINYTDCLESLQWAIGYWYHTSVAIIEEVIRYGSSCRFCVVLEDYIQRQGHPWLRTVRVEITPHELLGMYRYYRSIKMKK